MEETIRVRMETHLTKNHIIPNNSHGSQAGHSTLTAVQELEKTVKQNKGRGETTAILATDLTAAFDIIDHAILLEKMEHMGVCDKEYSIIQSYLENRSYYCEVQGFLGPLRKAKPYSVIQGDKLSGQFFGVYTLEMTQINKLIENQELYKFITGRNYWHNNSNKLVSSKYVDHINHVGSNRNKDKLETFIKDAHDLTVQLYTENRLSVNCEKTQILQVENNKNNTLDPDRKIITINDPNGSLIKAKTSMKLLGFMINSWMSIDTHLSRMKARIGMEYVKLKLYLHYINMTDRKVIINLKLRSILDYGLPLYMGEHE